MYILNVKSLSFILSHRFWDSGTFGLAFQRKKVLYFFIAPVIELEFHRPKLRFFCEFLE